MKKFTVHAGSLHYPVAVESNWKANTSKITELSISSTQDKLLLNVHDAATMLQCGRTMIYELMGKGEITPIKLGRLVRIPVAELESFVNKRRQEASWGIR